MNEFYKHNMEEKHIAAKNCTRVYTSQSTFSNAHLCDNIYTFVFLKKNQENYRHQFQNCEETTEVQRDPKVFVMF